MSYDSGIPSASQSPASFPAQGQINWARLKTLVSADHKFNDAAAGTDGYHKVCHFVNQSGSFGDNTPTAIAGVGQLYTKTFGGTEHLFYQRGTSGGATTETQLSVVPVRAAVNFTVNGSIQGTAFNVTSVTQNPSSRGSYVYRIVFTTAIPSANYIVVGMGMNASGVQSIVSIYPSATYGDSVTTGQVDVAFTTASAGATITRGMIAVLGG